MGAGWTTSQPSLYPPPWGASWQLHKVAGRNASPTRWPAPTAMTRNARHVTRARARPGPVAPTTWSSVKAGPFHSIP